MAATERRTLDLPLDGGSAAEGLRVPELQKATIPQIMLLPGTAHVKWLVSSGVQRPGILVQFGTSLKGQLSSRVFCGWVVSVAGPKFQQNPPSAQSCLLPSH